MTSDLQRPRLLVFVEGNSPADADPDVASYGQRPYPYLHMAPPRALAVDRRCVIAPYAREVRISCDLTFVVSRGVFRVTEDEATGSIAGYAAMISILDESCVTRLHDPAERERVLAGALRRWEESTCAMGDVQPIDGTSPVVSAETWLEVEGRPSARGTTACLKHRAARVLAFASHLMPVVEGSVFSLGSTGATATLGVGDGGPSQLSVSARVDGLPELRIQVQDKRVEAEWMAFRRRF